MSNRGDKKFIAYRKQQLGCLLDVFCSLKVSLKSISLVFLSPYALDHARRHRRDKVGLGSY